MEPARVNALSYHRTRHKQQQQPELSNELKWQNRERDREREWKTKSKKTKKKKRKNEHRRTLLTLAYHHHNKYNVHTQNMLNEHLIRLLRLVGRSVGRSGPLCECECECVSVLQGSSSVDRFWRHFHRVTPSTKIQCKALFTYWYLMPCNACVRACQRECICSCVCVYAQFFSSHWNMQQSRLNVYMILIIALQLSACLCTSLSPSVFFLFLSASLKWQFLLDHFHCNLRI